MFAAVGNVDVLVNNAGIAQQKLFTDLTEEDWDHMFAVDVKGVFHCCQLALPHMIRQKDGVIVNISSMWGAGRRFLRSSLLRCKSSGNRADKIACKRAGAFPYSCQLHCPGVIETGHECPVGGRNAGMPARGNPLEILGTPAHIADAVRFLCFQPRFLYHRPGLRRQWRYDYLRPKERKPVREDGWSLPRSRLAAIRL